MDSFQTLSHRYSYMNDIMKIQSVIWAISTKDSHYSSFRNETVVSYLSVHFIRILRFFCSFHFNGFDNNNSIVCSNHEKKKLSICMTSTLNKNNFYMEINLQLFDIFTVYIHNRQFGNQNTQFYGLFRCDLNYMCVVYQYNTLKSM